LTPGYEDSLSSGTRDALLFRLGVAGLGQGPRLVIYRAGVIQDARTNGDGAQKACSDQDEL
jgi:hypothetical protein